MLLSAGTGTGQLDVTSGVVKSNVVQYGGSAGTFAGGRPEVNLSHIAGAAVSTSSAQIGVNVVNAGGTAWASGAITASVLATDAIGSAQIAASAVTELQAGLSTLDAAGVRSAVGLAAANLDTQLTTIDDFLDTEVAAIKAKTDQLVFTTANRVDCSVIDKTGFSLSSSGLDAVTAYGKTLPQHVYYCSAGVAGKVSGAGTDTEVFKGLDGTTTLLTVTADTSGNRTAVVYG